MQPKRVIYTLIVTLVMLAIFVIVRRNEAVRKEMFDRHPHRLVLTRHARCRMECRHISELDIREILQEGVINLNKSDRRDRPCPTFALQGKTSGGEDIRVIVAQCESETRIVTCYNLNKDFECHCPGDEKKN